MIDLKIADSKTRPVVKEFFDDLEVAQGRFNEKEEIEWNEKAKRFKYKNTRTQEDFTLITRFQRLCNECVCFCFVCILP